jgi:hypothetical protein
MNTTTQAAPDVARTITEADVVAWLRAKVPAGSNIALGCNTDYHRFFHASIIGDYDTPTQFSDSADDAVRSVMANIKTPECIAAEKRAAAAKLLAEADALAPETVEAAT